MTLASVRGIPLRLHSSFLVLAGALIAWQLVTAGSAAALQATLLGLAVFGSVLLHELGHAFAGMRYGIRTRSITLYPFGGIAALEREPRTADEELVVAIAGPAVNGALFLAALPLALLGVPGAKALAVINLGMGVFNLIPAFPMDGGRVLRAWMAKRRGKTAATQRALKISRVFAWAFLAAGIFLSPSLALVGGFLLWATSAERRRMGRFMSGPQAAGWRPRPHTPAQTAARPAAVRSPRWDHPAL